ncbi:MAG: polysaccharide biosynthesis protein, partial [Phycisphaerales bacterium]|nr:polysaccharide biosynthesis protein [Phycisphaerales bacterium]
IRTHEVKTVFHAAAYKHVPLVESNVISGTKTNVMGTYEAARAAALNGVERFVLISTDKAAVPTSMMGAGKRLAECTLAAVNEEFRTQNSCSFCTVRFGNVMASSGSVIPLFRSQIEAGGPITVTHKDATRFFMTIPEAAELVLQSAAMTAGDDLYVLDMGKPFKILELAKRIVELSGASLHSKGNPNGIKIEFTGLRPGENLHEKLFASGITFPTKHPQILKVEEEPVEDKVILLVLRELRVALEKRNESKTRALLNLSLTSIETDLGLAEHMSGMQKVNF